MSGRTIQHGESLHRYIFYSSNDSWLHKKCNPFTPLISSSSHSFHARCFRVKKMHFSRKKGEFEKITITILTAANHLAVSRCCISIVFLDSLRLQLWRFCLTWQLKRLIVPKSFLNSVLTLFAWRGENLHTLFPGRFQLLCFFRP